MAESKKKPIEQYTHKDKERVNNPPAGLVTPGTDGVPTKKNYQYDPHLDPQLNWAGKAEHTSFEVPTVSLHVHERIDAKTVIEGIRKTAVKTTESSQMSLFESPMENPPIQEAIEFYKHKHNWSNRLVAGDSLLVMNSLLEKEGMSGKVQMVYFDPPYGIKYGSNFQPFTNKRDVKDGSDEDLTAEPEMLKAFRDTWELGIHSYLTYLRDRFLLARELLTESGSMFVQISDENVHLVRNLMDEVFGSENFVSQISFRKKTMPLGANLLEQMHDYILWAAKKKENIKYKNLFKDYEIVGSQDWKWIELPDKNRREMTSEEIKNPELLPKGSRIYRLKHPAPLGENEKNIFPYEFEGRVFEPPANGWGMDRDKLGRLVKANRVQVKGNLLNYILYHDDFQITKITNPWNDTVGPQNKQYVVQTGDIPLQRCLLMTTDPGDLVFDPTCLRKGTKVLVFSRDFFPPSIPVIFDCSTIRFPPFTGGVLQESEAFSGDVKGGKNLQLTGEWKPIEQLNTGEYVLSHDGKHHRVIRTIEREYNGLMIGISHEQAGVPMWVTGDHRILIQKRKADFGGDSSWKHIPYHHFQYAKDLRKKNTRSEKFIWKYLKEKFPDLKFRRQHPIGSYIVDFYSRELLLVIELDGEHHFTEEGKAYDGQRDQYLESCGVKVIRFENNIALNDPDTIGVIIEQYLSNQVDDEREWVRADELKLSDIIYFGEIQEQCRITHLEYDETSETVYDIEVEGEHSFLAEACMVHNCGSGTTASVAENWGRRWITCDTSRVAITLAKQRLLTSVFDYYELLNSQDGVGSGFKYKTVPHITLGSIANNEPPAQETLYDRPFIDNSKARVTGPFTVEAVPAPSVRSIDEAKATRPDDVMRQAKSKDIVVDNSIVRSGDTLRHEEWRKELLASGIRGKGGEKTQFSRVEAFSVTNYLSADAETSKGERAVISFGPEHAPLGKVQVSRAIEEAETLVPKPKLIVFCAFTFDPEAAKSIDETKWPGVNLLKAQMNADLITDDLKKKRSSNESFWYIGQPDVELKKIPLPPLKKGEKAKKDSKQEYCFQVEVNGFDYFNTKTNEIESGDKSHIVLWMLDTDYDGRSIFPSQIFLPLAGEKEGWKKLAKNLKAEIDEELIESYRSYTSLPFSAGDHKRIAVKIVDNRGIESLKVVELK